MANVHINKFLLYFLTVACVSDFQYIKTIVEEVVVKASSLQNRMALWWYTQEYSHCYQCCSMPFEVAACNFILFNVLSVMAILSSLIQ